MEAASLALLAALDAREQSEAEMEEFLVVMNMKFWLALQQTKASPPLVTTESVAISTKPHKLDALKSALDHGVFLAKVAVLYVILNSLQWHAPCLALYIFN